MNKTLKHGAESIAIAGVVAYGVYTYYSIVEFGAIIVAVALIAIAAINRWIDSQWNDRQLYACVIAIACTVFILATGRAGFGAIGAALLMLAFLFIVFQQTTKPIQKS